MNCSICGAELDEYERDEGICRNCQSSMLADDDIDIGIGS
jgi:DNA-directed RNA polymerase subunit RPC12/RpoP